MAQGKRYNPLNEEKKKEEGDFGSRLSLSRCPESNLRRLTKHTLIPSVRPSFSPFLLAPSVSRHSQKEIRTFCSARRSPATAARTAGSWSSGSFWVLGTNGPPPIRICKFSSLLSDHGSSYHLSFLLRFGTAAKKVGARTAAGRMPRCLSVARHVSRCPSVAEHMLWFPSKARSAFADQERCRNLQSSSRAVRGPIVLFYFLPWFGSTVIRSTYLTCCSIIFVISYE